MTAQGHSRRWTVVITSSPRWANEELNSLASRRSQLGMRCSKLFRITPNDHNASDRSLLNEA